MQRLLEAFYGWRQVIGGVAVSAMAGAASKSHLGLRHWAGHKKIKFAQVGVAYVSYLGYDGTSSCATSGVYRTRTQEEKESDTRIPMTPGRKQICQLAMIQGRETDVLRAETSNASS